MRQVELEKGRRKQQASSNGKPETNFCIND
jgi:hypothetical protein